MAKAKARSSGERQTPQRKDQNAQEERKVQWHSSKTLWTHVTANERIDTLVSALQRDSAEIVLREMERTMQQSSVGKNFKLLKDQIKNHLVRIINCMYSSILHFDISFLQQFLMPRGQKRKRKPLKVTMTTTTMLIRRILPCSTCRENL